MLKIAFEHEFSVKVNSRTFDSHKFFTLSWKHCFKTAAARKRKTVPCELTSFKVFGQKAEKWAFRPWQSYWQKTQTTSGRGYTTK